MAALSLALPDAHARTPERTATPAKAEESKAAPSDPTDEDTLLIGFAGPLSGPSAGVGKSMQNAVQLAVDEANRKGLRLAGKNYRLRLLAQDDRADPATAEYVARYLVSQHVLGVVGHWNSGASLAAAPIYHAAGVIQISPATMSRRFTAQAYPGVFRTIPNNDAVGQLSAEFAVRKLGVKTLATIDDRTPFGKGLAEQVARTARELGVEVTGSYSVSDKTSDFNGPLLQIRKRSPDLIFFGGLDWQAGLLAKAIRRLKIDSRLMGSAGTVGLPFLMQAGADADGALVLEPGPAADKMPGWKAFRQRYGQSFDTNVDLYATFAYDAAQALISGMRQSNATDGAAIAREMHKLKLAGVSGTIAFNEEGDLLHPSFTMYEVQDRRWAPVLQIDGAPRP
ncbi:branched-chain amino acid ABC transporter substrate-binding protein [Herbaspirillum sp. LeCh32-8]|uniref:branched-chain amino acid ABC transporter substrate-binding protein n=1 Tax=Herbaspirillum sp. LeCh32-8 TaxID=2821356 RepID=UPI001AE463D3|nr:branched-chain amino acid ABC transporter substrate-binding protein [Herbaspirillum sp. LeCh32-8]MBP0600197.1 branched-chain amino acid ABC transporter substrate-binding protein [Herbaspirillum sp. LeCh32-8]